jgi:ABC-type amino acid transport substrate-binding protein
MSKSIKLGILPPLLLAIIFSITGCSAESKPPSAINDATIASYRDIPGLTDEEINAIEELKRSAQSFSYGSLLSTEAFVLPDGANQGFAAKFCELLSELFDMPFAHELYDWTNLKSGIDAKTIDFSGDFVPTPERHIIYFMTHPIAQRALGVFTYGDRIKIESEFDLNGLRIGFLEGSVHANAVRETYPALSFETVNVQHTAEGLGKLESGLIDAYIMESVDKIIFQDNHSIRFTEVLPLVYNPVSLTTAKDELKVIISVINKYIAAGGEHRLQELYGSGDFEYSRYILSQSFTDDEAAYIANLNALGRKVPVALEHDQYPVCFYNKNDNEFQGIVPDMLNEISLLTGIKFDIVTKSDTPFYRMLEMLDTGEAAFVSEMLFTPERQNKFLWSDPYFTSRYSL